jgi:DNA-binding MarR family transcriptional regulator
MQQVDSTAHELASTMQQTCVGLRVGRLQRLVGREFDQALRPLGLSISQLEVLSAFVITGTSLRPSDLASWFCIGRSTMSRNLSLMEKHGLLVTTSTSPTGRSTRFGITEHGRESLAKATDAWRQAQDAITSKLGDNTAITLDAWIAKLSDPEAGTARVGAPIDR